MEHVTIRLAIGH